MSEAEGVVDGREGGAEFSLYAPVLAEHPGVAIAYAYSGKPALIAVVAQVFEIGAHELVGQVERTDIILSADQMAGEKVTGHSLAKPITGLRLHHPVFPLPFVAERPEVDLT